MQNEKIPSKSDPDGGHADSGEKFLVHVPAAIALRSKFTLDELNRNYLNAGNEHDALVWLWRSNSLVELQKADNITFRASSGHFKRTHTDLADLIRATTMASIFAQCANDLEESNRRREGFLRKGYGEEQT